MNYYCVKYLTYICIVKTVMHCLVAVAFFMGHPVDKCNIQRSFAPKPFGQSKSNFTGSIYMKGGGHLLRSHGQDVCLNGRYTCMAKPLLNLLQNC